MIPDFVGKALSVVAKVAGIGSISEATATIKNAIAGNDQLRAELQKMELAEKELILKEAESLRRLYVAEIQSEDKFVRRARPAMLWLCLGLLSLNFGVIPLFNSVAMYAGWEQVALLIPDLPEPLYYLIGTMFSVYTGARTWDKMKKGS